METKELQEKMVSYYYSTKRVYKNFVERGDLHEIGMLRGLLSVAYLYGNMSNEEYEKENMWLLTAL